MRPPIAISRQRSIGNVPVDSTVESCSVTEEMEIACYKKKEKLKLVLEKKKKFINHKKKKSIKKNPLLFIIIGAEKVLGLDFRISDF